MGHTEHLLSALPRPRASGTMSQGGVRMEGRCRMGDNFTLQPAGAMSHLQVLLYDGWQTAP